MSSSPSNSPFGERPQGPAGYDALGATSAQASNKATVALVLGVAGIFCIPLICPVLALIFGYQARAETANDSNRSRATAGIVLGWIGIVWSIVIIIAVAAG